LFGNQVLTQVKIRQGGKTEKKCFKNISPVYCHLRFVSKNYGNIKVIGDVYSNVRNRKGKNHVMLLWCSEYIIFISSPV